MSTKNFFLAAIITLGSGALCSAQTTWYVSQSGSNDTGNGTEGTPWATVSHALAQSSVVDGDFILLQGGIADSFTVTKSVTIFGGSILVNGLNSANGHGIEVQADNVRLSPAGIGVDKTTVTSAGTIVYVGKPDGVSPIVNFEMQFTTVRANDGSYAFPPVPSSGLQLMEIHNPSDSLIADNQFHPAAPTNLSPAVEPDNAIVIYGATPGASPWGIQLLNNTISPAEMGGTFRAGTGISLQPGNAGMLDGVRLFQNNSAFGLTTGFEIRDTESGANRGITNVEMERNVTYFNLNGFHIHGLANDPGAGISNVRIFRNSGLWNTTQNANAGILISQDGMGTSNIDFDTVRAVGNGIFNNNDATSFAVLNEIDGTTFQAGYNYWGFVLPEVGVSANPMNRVSTGVDIEPAFVGQGSGEIFIEEIDTPGGTASFGQLTSPPNTQLDVNLEDGMTGTFAFSSRFYNQSNPYPGGTGGFVGDLWLGQVIQIETDLADGEYVMLIQYRYSEFSLSQVGIAEEDLVLYYFNTNPLGWRPAVNGNTRGVPTWEGNSPVPTSVTEADLGRHGVDTANNIAWAVVDHTTDYAGGQGINGQGVEPTSVSDWNLF